MGGGGEKKLPVGLIRRSIEAKTVEAGYRFVGSIF